MSYFKTILNLIIAIRVFICMLFTSSFVVFIILLIFLMFSCPHAALLC